MVKCTWSAACKIAVRYAAAASETRCASHLSSGMRQPIIPEFGGCLARFSPTATSFSALKPFSNTNQTLLPVPSETSHTTLSTIVLYLAMRLTSQQRPQAKIRRAFRARLLTRPCRQQLMSYKCFEIYLIEVLFITASTNALTVIG